MRKHLKRLWRTEILHVAGFALAVVLAIMVLNALDRSRPEKIGYGQFRALLAQGKVSELTIGKDRVMGLYRPAKGPSRRFVAPRPSSESPRFNEHSSRIGPSPSISGDG